MVADSHTAVRDPAAEIEVVFVVDRHKRLAPVPLGTAHPQGQAGSNWSLLQAR